MSDETSLNYRHYGASFLDIPADLVVRSTDGVHFLAHKQILALASPFFATFPYDINNDVNQTAGGLPVIPFTNETARTLEHILRLCYPQDLEIDVGLAEIMAVLEAAKKYDMQGVRGRASRQLIRHAKDDAVDTYAVAVVFGLDHVAREAARSSLTREMRAWNKAYLGHINGQQYHALLDYRERCVTAVCTASLANFIEEVVRAVGDSSLYYCPGCQCLPSAHVSKVRVKKFGLPVQETFTPGLWWVKLFTNLRTALQGKPCSSIVRDIFFSLPIHDTRCATCKNKANDALRRTVVGVESLVERRVGTVSIAFLIA